MYKNVLRKNYIIFIIIVIIICVIILYYLINNMKKYELNNDLLFENTSSSKDTKENEEGKDEIKEKIIVHVAGAVNNEGIYELDINSRIMDAINLAGGLRNDANIRDINLANKLEDGMKIYIPTNNEIKDIEKENTEDKYIISSSNNKNKDNKKISINTASIEELETLPGIGKTTALKIVNYIKENGKFKALEDLKKVSGIGNSKYEKIKDFISL